MKSKLSLDEIRLAASAMRDKIKSLKVSYHYTSTPTEAEIAMRPARCPACDQRRTFAMRGPLQRSELEGLDDGKQIRLRYVMDGTHIVYELKTHDRQSQVARIDRLPEIGRWQFVHREPFCLMTDIRYSDINRIAGGSWGFPHVLSLDPTGFHVRENQEKIGDRWCHVIEYPRNAYRVVKEIADGEQAEFFWVDSDNPAIMVKKESCFTQGGKFFPWRRVALGSFKEVEDGVWIPMQIGAEGFPSLTDNAKAGTLVSESRCTVTDIKLNANVTAEDFEYRIHDGERLGCWSTPTAEEENSPIFRIWEKTDPELSIAMPLDQPSNERLEKLIMEKDPLFFRS